MNGKIIVNTDDYTVNSYIDSYDYIDIDEIKILTKVFDSIKDHELSDGNYLNGHDNYVRSGIRISKAKKKFHAIEQVEMSQNQLIQMYDGNDKDVYFYRSVASLLNATPYFSSSDRITLNFLFDGFKKFGKGVDEIVEYNGSMYLPVCNYKVKFKS